MKMATQLTNEKKKEKKRDKPSTMHHLQIKHRHFSAIFLKYEVVNKPLNYSLANAIKK